MGAKTRFMGQTSCILLGLECHVWHMRDGINVIGYFSAFFFFFPNMHVSLTE